MSGGRRHIYAFLRKIGSLLINRVYYGVVVVQVLCACVFVKVWYLWPFFVGRENGSFLKIKEKRKK